MKILMMLIIYHSSYEEVFHLMIRHNAPIQMPSKCARIRLDLIGSLGWT